MQLALKGFFFQFRWSLGKQYFSWVSKEQIKHFNSTTVTVNVLEFNLHVKPTLLTFVERCWLKFSFILVCKGKCWIILANSSLTPSNNFLFKKVGYFEAFKGRCNLIQRYFCKGYGYEKKAYLSKTFWDLERNIWVTTHFSELGEQP